MDYNWLHSNIHESTICSRRSSGTAPESSNTSWNSRRLNFSPSFCSARLRSSVILSSPILYASACPGQAM